MKLLFSMCLALICLQSCDSFKDNTKKAINKTGETIGSTVSEFGKGVSEGIEEQLVYTVELSEELKTQGLELGEVIVSNDSTGTDNKLSVYIIFDQDIKTEIKAIVSSKRGKEMGRSRCSINALKDEAAYFDFIFPVQTNIDRDSKIVLSN